MHKDALILCQMIRIF